LLEPDFKSKGWFLPRGDKESLEQACNEIQKFSRRKKWTPKHRTAVIARVNSLASIFLFFQWLEWMNPPLSKTDQRKGLREILAAIRHLQTLTVANRTTVVRALHGWREDQWPFFQLMLLGGLRQLDHIFEEALANDEFRRAGRPESSVSANLILVLRTRDLLEQFAGQRPGFTREKSSRKINVKAGPLARTAMAVYQCSTGKPANSFDTYIAQAEQLSKAEQLLQKNMYATAIKLYLRQ